MIRKSAGAFMIMISMLIAQGLCGGLATPDSLRIGLNISLLNGQIMSGYSTAQVGSFEHAWIQEGHARIKLESYFNRHTYVNIEAEGNVGYSYRIPLSLWDKEFVEDQKVAKFDFLLRQAKGVYTFGEGTSAEFFPLQIGVGILEYKYNPEVRNLGEYLFRTSSYPVYFLNWFDGPFYRMAGLIATTKPFDWIKFDALLFSEMYQVPLQDFSLAGMATFNVKKIVEVGIGVNLSRIFSVDDNMTTSKHGPRGADNIYAVTDSLGVADTNNPGNSIIWGDTSYYTFKSTKVAARLMFDPKLFIPVDIFGREDLKIYGEVAILGTQNYPVGRFPGNMSHPDYYYDMKARVPMMVGFNVPTFKILDVLSIELEYLQSPYVPSSKDAFKYGLPRPDAETDQRLKVNNTKWSVYAKKSYGAFSLIVQFARDHFQPGNNNIGYTERTDVMSVTKDWWWMTKIQCSL